MASGDEEEVVPTLEFVMPNVESAVQLAFQRLDSVNLRDEFRIGASVMKTTSDARGVGGDMRWIGPVQQCAPGEMMEAVDVVAKNVVQ